MGRKTRRGDKELLCHSQAGVDCMYEVTGRAVFKDQKQKCNPRRASAVTTDYCNARASDATLSCNDIEQDENASAMH